METEQRQEAVFGSFDGAVSIIGFIFGLVIHHASHGTIAIGGFGGAIAAGVSMGVGEYEKHDGNWRSSLSVASVMFLASLGGSMIAILPFFFLATAPALVLSIIGCLLVATWIGWMKHRGLSGYIVAWATLIGAALLVLAAVTFIP